MCEVEVSIQGMEPNTAEAVEQKESLVKLDLDEPSEELLQWAKENINEDPDKKDLLISDLRDMIYARGECSPTKTDDEFLLRFLRARYFSVNMAHKLYANYHNFMEEAPEYFRDVNLERLSEIKKTNIFNSPPSRDQHGRRMIILKIGEWVPAEFSPKELFQFAIFLIQVSLLEQKTQIKGVVALFDLSGLSLEMVWYMTPTLAKHLVSISVNAMPTRLEAVHFLYGSWMFDTAFSMIKGMISYEVKDRIHFHSELDTLYTHIDPKYLPKSIGGSQDDYSLESWYNDIAQSENKKIRAALEELGYPVQKFFDTEIQT